ncbi:MAG: Mth938-like domain-containing protein [Burkholderiaceae bacterium]
MKLHADRPDAHTIQSYGEGWIAVNGEKIGRSVVLSSTGDRADWPCESFSDLQAGHFEGLLAYQPEVVIFGSGRKLRFAHPSLHAALMAQRVGVETMDTLAACRTFNILAQEGRRVVVALLMEPVQN